MEIKTKSQNKLTCSICNQDIPEDSDWILTPEGYKCQSCWETTTEKVYR